MRFENHDFHTWPLPECQAVLLDAVPLVLATEEDGALESVAGKFDLIMNTTNREITKLH